MNRIIRSCGLLMLGMTAACAAEMTPPAEATVAPSAPPASNAPKVAKPPAAKRNGAPFSQRVRNQLAASGIEVYAGPEPERTTVEQKWIVPGYPMGRLDDINDDIDPEWVPAKYASHLLIVWPKVVKTGSHPYIDPSQPGGKGSCSGTQVASEAVLTAAHCVIDYHDIGKDKVTKLEVREMVRAYSITSRPRRNGGGSIARAAPHGAQETKKSFWRFGNWPGDDRHFYRSDHDFAVLRLKTQPAPFIPTAPLRNVASPQGVFFETVHYPFAFERGSRMFYSAGDIGDPHCRTKDGVLTCFPNVYNHRISMEPGSSGSGLFEFGVDGVAGIIISEDKVFADPSKRRPGQKRSGFPNQALMFTPTINAQIADWINAPL
jgi:hypothetical protein